MGCPGCGLRSCLYFRKPHSQETRTVSSLHCRSRSRSVGGPAPVRPDGPHHSGHSTFLAEDVVPSGLVPALFNPLISPSKTLTVSEELAEQLIWWSLCSNLLVGRPFGPLQPSVQLTTDASTTGWEAHIPDLTTNGHWSPEDACLHINILELLTVFKALSIQASSHWENGAGGIRQHHSSVLPEQARGHTLTCLLYTSPSPRD